MILHAHKTQPVVYRILLELRVKFVSIVFVLFENCKYCKYIICICINMLQMLLDVTEVVMKHFFRPSKWTQQSMTLNIVRNVLGWLVTLPAVIKCAKEAKFKSDTKRATWLLHCFNSFELFDVISTWRAHLATFGIRADGVTMQQASVHLQALR